MNEPLPAALMRNPYPGLRSFRREEADLFFGREEQVEEMLTRLETHRFMAVVGSSGCGKSSLVQAGLLPALEEGFLSGAGPHWRMAIMRPGNLPFKNLTEALLAPAALRQERGHDDKAVGFLQATLRRGPLGLVEAVQETHLPEGTNLLLVVDQFEEIFRYREQASNVNDADAFVNLVLASTQPSPIPRAGQEVPIYVVITMRSDFIGDCAVFAGLPEGISESQSLTPRLTRSQYYSAITEPANISGGELEPNLVNCMLNELGESPDQLPVLQHVLMRMWALAGPAQPGAKKVLTLDEYKETGGLSKALSCHADEAFSDLNKEQQKITQILFRSLCERSQSKRDTRRPIKLKEVAALAGVDVAAVKPVVEAFRRSDRNFIMPPAPTPLEDDTVLDISHESLISHWNKLNDWVEAEAKSAETFLLLASTARHWKQGKAELWRKLDLGNALNWKEEEHPNAAWAARYGGDFEQAMDFLAESEAERDKERNEQEQARRRELAHQARAEEKTRFAKWMTGLALTALMAMLLALWFWKDADRQGNLATQEGKIALSRYLASESTNLSSSPQLSLLLSLEAVYLSHRDLSVSRTLSAADLAKLTNDTESALRRAVGAMGSTPLKGQGGPVFKMAFSPVGRILASASLDETIRLQDLDNPDNSRILRTGNHAVFSIVFSRDGESLACGGWDGTVCIWDLNNQKETPELVLPDHESFVPAIAFSPDKHFLASAGNDRTIRLWDLKKPKTEPIVLEGHEDGVTAVVFRQDGHTLASFSKDGTIRLWDVENPATKPNPIQTNIKGIFMGFAFSPDGNYFASTCPEKGLSLWNLNSPADNPRRLGGGHDGTVLAVTFSLDSHTLVSVGADRTVRHWNLADKSSIPEPRVFIRQQDITNVVLSPDSQTLASSNWGESTIRLWDLKKDPAIEPRVLSCQKNAAGAVAFFPDGHTLASAAAGKEKAKKDHSDISLWDLNNPSAEPQFLGEHDGNVTAMALSPDGKTLASAGTDSTIRLWDLMTNPAVKAGPRSILRGHKEAVLAIAFSPDGKTLTSAGRDRAIRLWDLTKPSPEPRIMGEHDDIVSAMAYNPDGHTLASAGDDRTIRLWDLTNSAVKAGPRSILRGHEEAVLAIAFSPDGKTLTSAGKDRAVRRWDLTKPSPEAQVIREHDEIISALAFSPDGHTLASAGDDNILRLWDLTAPTAKPRIFRGHENAVPMITFSPDGRILASAGGADHTIRLWRTQIDDLIDLACRHAGRNMTDGEWREYLGKKTYRKTCPELP